MALKSFKTIKYSLVTLFVILQIYLLFINTHDSLDIDVYPNKVPTPSIFQNNTVGQTFVAQKDDLSRIDIMLGTHGRENNKDVIFRVFQLEPERKLIRRVTFNASEVKNNHYHTIRFSPVKESQGTKYYFILSSPRSTLNNSISAWMNNKNIYRFGEAYFQNKEQKGDLVFRVYSQRPIYTELGRIVRNYEGIFGSQLLLIMILILFEAVQIIFLVKLLDFLYKQIKAEE